MLLNPRAGTQSIACSQSSTSSEGITVTASGSTHTKGSWGATPLWTSTPFTAYGITIGIGGMATASTNIKGLVDIGIGAASSEVVLIPNLMAAGSTWVGSMNTLNWYHFPVLIPSGTRVNARIQANTASDTATVIAWIFGQPTGPGGWYGTRVTDYGTNTGTSGGVAHTPGSSSSYATATQIVASTTNPIKYLQVHCDLAADTSATSMRGLFRLGFGATPNYFLSEIPWGESTTVESFSFTMANDILSRVLLNIPAASDIRLSAMVNGTGESRQWALWGVD